MSIYRITQITPQQAEAIEKVDVPETKVEGNTETASNKDETGFFRAETDESGKKSYYFYIDDGLFSPVPLPFRSGELPLTELATPKTLTDTDNKINVPKQKEEVLKQANWRFLDFFRNLEVTSAPRQNLKETRYKLISDKEGTSDIIIEDIVTYVEDKVTKKPIIDPKTSKPFENSKLETHFRKIEAYAAHYTSSSVSVVLPLPVDEKGNSLFEAFDDPRYNFLKIGSNIEKNFHPDPDSVKVIGSDTTSNGIIDGKRLFTFSFDVLRYQQDEGYRKAYDKFRDEFKKHIYEELQIDGLRLPSDQKKELKTLRDKVITGPKDAKGKFKTDPALEKHVTGLSTDPDTKETYFKLKGLDPNASAADKKQWETVAWRMLRARVMPHYTSSGTQFLNLIILNTELPAFDSSKQMVTVNVTVHRDDWKLAEALRGAPGVIINFPPLPSKEDPYWTFAITANLGILENRQKLVKLMAQLGSRITQPHLEQLRNQKMAEKQKNPETKDTPLSKEEFYELQQQMQASLITNPSQYFRTVSNINDPKKKGLLFNYDYFNQMKLAEDLSFFASPAICDMGTFSHIWEHKMDKELIEKGISSENPLLLSKEKQMELLEISKKYNKILNTFYQYAKGGGKYNASLNFSANQDDILSQEEHEIYKTARAKKSISELKVTEESAKKYRQWEIEVTQKQIQKKNSEAEANGIKEEDKEKLQNEINNLKTKLNELKYTPALPDLSVEEEVIFNDILNIAFEGKLEYDGEKEDEKITIDLKSHELIYRTGTSLTVFKLDPKEPFKIIDIVNHQVYSIDYKDDDKATAEKNKERFEEWKLKQDILHERTLHMAITAVMKISKKYSHLKYNFDMEGFNKDKGITQPWYYLNIPLFDRSEAPASVTSSLPTATPTPSVPLPTDAKDLWGWDESEPESGEKKPEAAPEKPKAPLPAAPAPTLAPSPTAPEKKASPEKSAADIDV